MLSQESVMTEKERVSLDKNPGDLTISASDKAEGEFSERGETSSGNETSRTGPEDSSGGMAPGTEPEVSQGKKARKNSMKSSKEDSGKNSNTSLRKKSRKRVLVLIAVGAAAAVVIAVGAAIGIFKGHTTGETKYLSATASTQDLTTTDTYTGEVEAVNSQSVMSAIAGAKITEVDVEEGDTVEEGDVIAKLDTSDVEEQIKELQTQMDSSAAKSAISIEQVETEYNNLVTNIADGLDSTTNNALSQIDSAFSALTSAQESYNNEVNFNNNDESQTILSAINSVQSAYYSLQSSALQAEGQYTNLAKQTDSDTYETQVAEVSLNLDQAQTNYDAAVQNYEIAKQTEENSLTKLYDQLISAEISYIKAITDYNTTQRSIAQKLQSYQLQIAAAKANADQSGSELQLEELENSLDDYVITAPMSGEITSLDCQVGDVTQVSSTTSLATITNYDVCKVSISVSEYDITSLSIGDKVTVTIDALEKSFDGTVSAIDKIGSNSNSIAYFTVEVEFTPDDDVLEGMTAEVSVTKTDQADAVVLPSDAVMTGTDGSSYVYVLADDGTTYEKKTVTLGETDGAVTQITDGVSDGDTVYYIIATQDETNSSSSGGFFSSIFGGGTGTSQGGGGGMPSGGGQGSGMPSGGGEGGGGMPSGGPGGQ